MKFEYESNHLIYRILSRASAPEVLDFYTTNQTVFETYDPAHSEHFYTLTYQENLLHMEQEQFLRNLGGRFWIFHKDQPQQICGCVAFSHLLRGCYARADIGYKIASSHQGRGIGTEAVSFCSRLMLTEGRLHRIEAYIHPSNIASLSLARKCNYFHEGTAFSYAKLHGKWENLERYVLLADSTFPPDTPSS